MNTANLDRASRDGELRIVLREPGTTTVLRLSGEWDIAGLPAARRVMSDALSGHPESLVLDLSDLTFIDSSGLHATIELAYRANAQRTRLVIIPGPYPVQRAFELCGLIDRLPFIDPRRPGSAAAASRCSSG
jgi:anti-sigma B factor antagonist